MSITKIIPTYPVRNTAVSDWKKYYRLNNYYHKNLQRFAAHLIPSYASVLEIGSNGGELLRSIANTEKTGVVMDNSFLKVAKSKYPNISFLNVNDLTKLRGKKFDYILVNHVLSEVVDVQNFIEKLKTYTNQDTRIVVFFYNYLWKPILNLGEMIGLKRPQKFEPNWLSGGDIDNLFSLDSFEKVKSGRKFLIPYDIPYISDFVNRYISPLPIINSLSFIQYAIYRPIKSKKDYSVSIIIPERNEAGHIRGILKSLPKFGKKTEVIFVEGHSKDNTYDVIKEEIKKYNGPITAKLYKQKGKGKGDAVRLGFSKARNELFMILDGDLTVGPEELPKFYRAISKGQGDLIMGSRLVYPMEKQAMRTLNILGNKFFSVAFTFLLDQKIKDTLCGTKVLLKKDYEKIVKNRKIFGDFDPFGDYDLIFGSAKQNLKILEIPIRYKQRVYGTTNISRFTHGWLLFKMVYFAAKNLKFV
jgi:Glycosyl transferase family 2/Methyltransferase domain